VLAKQQMVEQERAKKGQAKKWMTPEALQRLIRILDRHQPADEKERADVQQIRQMALAHPAIFSQENYPGHITGSALVVNVKAGRVLLHFHKSLGRWLQFGGHAAADVFSRWFRATSGRH
jgi:hypothetical protein